MCGRAYSTFTAEEISLRYLNRKDPRLPPLQPSFNFCPTQEAPVLTMGAEGRELGMLRWGLVPAWIKDPKEAKAASYKMINARSETVHEKPSFRKAFSARRCVIPFSGFFEWKREGESKRPFRISLKDDPIMNVAGIWEAGTFAVLTTGPNAAMEKVHDRMPVILTGEQLDLWLDPRDPGTERVRELMKPCPSEWLELVEVSTRVNSPRNNSVENLAPLPSTS